MKERLAPGWWVFYLLWCCMDLCWSAKDITKDDWFNLAIDGFLAVLFFFAAHFTWEKGYYE